MRKNETIELYLCYEEEDELETGHTHTKQNVVKDFHSDNRISLSTLSSSRKSKNINSNKVSKPKEQIIEIYIVSIKTL